jgi:hypothetical protein
MLDICGTFIQQAVAPVVHGAVRLAHAARHLIRPFAGRARHVIHHAPAVAMRPLTWVGLACKAIPLVVAGGGLLVSHPTDAPPVPATPSSTDAPAPVFSPWSPPIWIAPPAGPMELTTDTAFGPQSFGPPAFGPPAFGRQTFGPQTFGPQPAGPQVVRVPEVGPPPDQVIGSVVTATPEPSSGGILLAGLATTLLIRTFRRPGHWQAATGQN